MNYCPDISYTKTIKALEVNPNTNEIQSPFIEKIIAYKWE